MAINGAVEWMAFIIAVAFIIKLLVLLIKPKSWINVVNKVYTNKWLTIVVALVLGYLSLQALLDYGISIVEIYAVFLFLAFLMMLSLAVYSKDAIEMGRKLLKDKQVVKKAWLALIVWLALTVWVLVEIFRV